MEKRLITIITSTYNAVKDLPATIQSVKNQTSQNIQWIIIDGASKDGTVGIIKENESIIDFWITEEDNGIYDAWNKALNHIKGDWVLFLGAGDILYSDDTMKDFSLHLMDKFPQYNLVYGQVNVVDNNGSVVAEWGKPWKEVEDDWETIRPALPPHPSSFIHSSIFKRENYLFPKELKIAGDSHSLMVALKDKQPLYIPEKVNIMLFGGVSTDSKNLLLIVKELKRINKEFNVKPPLNVYLYNMAKIYIKVIFSFIFSEKINKLAINNFQFLKLRIRSKKN